MKLNLNLPDPNEKPDRENVVEATLKNLKFTIEDKYNEKILVLITTSATFNDERENVLSYAIYLSFINRNKFSYRLFEVNCLNADGGLPVELIAFSGPSASFGKAHTKEEFELAIEKIFKDRRTRNIILSNYNM